MSQTETLMLVALGFVLALVVVLLFARFVWNAGQRLAKRRVERDKPVLIRDLEADRDQLRAAKAVMQQKLDSSLAEAKARVAEHQAETARHRNRVQDLIQTVNQREDEIERQAETIRAQDAEAADKVAERDAQTELISALRRDIDARDDDIQLLKSELQKTMTLLDGSKDQLIRLESERDSAVEQVKEIALEQRAPPRPPEPQYDLPPALQPVHPAPPPREARRFDFGPADNSLTVPPRPQPQQQRAPSELADLLNTARRNMMQAQAEKVLQERETGKARGNPIAGVISVAQRLRKQEQE